MTEVAQTKACSVLTPPVTGNTCTKLWKTGSDMTYFIANAEDFTILLDHSVQVCVGAFIRSHSLKHLTHTFSSMTVSFRSPPSPSSPPSPDVHVCASMCVVDSHYGIDRHQPCDDR